MKARTFDLHRTLQVVAALSVPVAAIVASCYLPEGSWEDQALIVIMLGWVIVAMALIWRENLE